MEKYDAEYDVFDAFIRGVLANFHIRYDEEAWLAMQEKLDTKSVESRGAEEASQALIKQFTGKNSDIE